MEIRQLEAFAAAMSCGSVSGAARILGRSQPAISRLIQELEAELGHALFHRQGPRVSPTSQGYLLYEEVEHALFSLHRIRERAQEIARDEDQPYRIIATNALSVGLLPRALARIHASLGAARITMTSTSAERVVHTVLNGGAQWGVSSLPLDHRGIRVEWIGEAPCVAVLPEHDPLAQQALISLSSLSNRSIISLLNRHRLRHRIEHAWSGLDTQTPRAFIETNTSMTAQAAVRTGLGVAILEPASVIGATLPGVVVRPLDVHIPFYFGVIGPQSQPERPALSALSQALHDVAQELLPGFVRHDADSHADLLRTLYASEPHTL